MGKSSKASASASVGRLELYLYSNGSQLPSDWTHYVIPKYSHDEHIVDCLFCGSVPAMHAVYKYDIGSSSKGRGAHTGTYCCSRCASEIGRMEQEAHNFIRPLMTSPQNHGDVHGLFDDPIGQEHEDPMELEETAAEAIAKFLHNSILPDGWGQYLHIYPRGTALFKNHCFFCTNAPNATQVFALVEIPMVHNDYVNGGHVYMCPSCSEDYHETSSGINFAKDVCFECTVPYLIDSNEWQFRTAAGTLSRHLCPECLSTLIEDGRLFGDPNDEGYLRFDHTRNCSFCPELVSVDKTLDADYLRAHVLIDSETACCDECSLGEFKTSYKNAKTIPVAVRNREKETLHFYEMGDKILVRRKIKGVYGLSLTPIPREKFLDHLLDKFL